MKLTKEFFGELNKIDLQTTSMSFCTIFSSMDEETYITAIQVIFLKLTFFLQRLCKNIRTNPFGIHVGNIWQANTYVQFIFDPYVATSYYTSYLTKIDKTMTKEF